MLSPGKSLASRFSTGTMFGKSWMRSFHDARGSVSLASLSPPSVGASLDTQIVPVSEAASYVSILIAFSREQGCSLAV